MLEHLTVLSSTHNLCLSKEIRKNVYPYKPQFYCIKVNLGVRGCSLHRHACMMHNHSTVIYIVCMRIANISVRKVILTNANKKLALSEPHFEKICFHDSVQARQNREYVLQKWINSLNFGFMYFRDCTM